MASDLRVQLASNRLGSLTLTDDPKGLDNLEQMLKRSDDNDGVIHQITLSLDFPKAGKAFIQSEYESDGIEAIVIVNIFIRNNNARTWEIYYTGQIDFTKYTVTEVVVTVPIAQLGFQVKTLNLIDVDVDAETLVSENGSPLPATSTIDLEYHAKSILKQYSATFTDDSEFSQIDALIFNFPACFVGPCEYDQDQTIWGSFDNGQIVSQELTDTFTYPYGFDSIVNSSPDEIYNATDPGFADIDLKATFKMSIIVNQSGTSVDTDLVSPCASPGIFGGRELKVYFVHKDKNDNVLNTVVVGTSTQIAGCGGDQQIGDYETFEYKATGVKINQGDKIYFYFTVHIYGTFSLSGGELVGRSLHHEFIITGDPVNTHFNISTSTTFPASKHKTILIYELLKKIFQYYTDQVDCFKSDFFGRTDSDDVYDVDGPGSLMGVTNGRILRNIALNVLNPAPGDGDDTENSTLDALVVSLPPSGIGTESTPLDNKVYGQFSNANLTSMDLKTTYNYPWGYLATPNEIYNAAVAGTIDIDFQVKFKLQINATKSGSGAAVEITSPCSSVGLLASREVKVWFEHRDKSNSVKLLYEVGTMSTVTGCGDDSVIGDYETFAYAATGVAVEQGDKIYFYHTVRIFGTYEIPGGITNTTLIHHEFIVQGDPNQSHYNLSAAVDEDTVVETSDIFVNGTDAFKSLTAIWNLAMGFENINGTQKVVIEPKSYFYNKTSLILSLGKVTDLKKSINMTYYYSIAEFGYPKLNADGTVNGVDEFNTIRRYSAPLTQATQKLSQLSIWHASGYEIESQRRLQGQTTDSQNDAANFMVMVVRDGAGFKTERNEAFTLVTNLFDPSTAYNLRISPARNAIRWIKQLAGPLWAVVNKIYKFSYGEGNYQMTSKLATEGIIVDEGGNLDVNGIEPDWIPETYAFTYPITRDEFNIILANPYGYITFEDTLGNSMDGFILQVSHKPMDELGTFSLLKVYRKPSN